MLNLSAFKSNAIEFNWNRIKLVCAYRKNPKGIYLPDICQGFHKRLNWAFFHRGHGLELIEIDRQTAIHFNELSVSLKMSKCHFCLILKIRNILSKAAKTNKIRHLMKAPKDENSDMRAVSFASIHILIMNLMFHLFIC